MSSPWSTHVAAVAFLAVLGAPALLLMGGCEPWEPDQDDVVSTLDHCSVSADCTLNRICVQGMCVADIQREVMISVHVTPPHGAGFKPQQFIDLHVDQNRRIPDLKLIRPVKVSGTVTSPDNPLARSIPARMVATSKGERSGSSSRVEARAENGEGFTLFMLPGIYDVSVFPDSEFIPPYKLKDISIERDGTLNVTLPSQSEYLLVSGRCVIQDGDPAGVPHIRIQAFDDEHTNLSTVTVSDLNGNFRLVLPPGDRTYTFRLTPTDFNPFYPTVDIHGLHLSSDVQEVHIGDLPLGAGGEATEINGTVYTPDAQPLPGTTVELRGRIGNGTMYRNTSSDENGRFSLEVSPGTYTLRIIPTPGNELMLMSHNLEVSKEGRLGLEYTLNKKPKFFGRVVEPQSFLPLQGVMVEALMSVTSTHDDGVFRTSFGQTGPDGTFSLLIDPGMYQITFIPPQESGLPRWTEHDIQLPTQENQEKSFVLKEPGVLFGKILAPDGKPLAGSIVDVFLSPQPPPVDGDAPTEPDPLEPPAPSAPAQVGSGQTDPDGWFRVLLPIS